MGTYTVGMISIVLISTIVLIYILRRNKLMNISMAVAIAISSIAICLILPLAFSQLTGFGLGLAPSLLITLLVYMTVVPVVAVALSLVMSDSRMRKLWEKVGGNRLFQVFDKLCTKLADYIKQRRNKSYVDGLKELETGNILEKSVDTGRNIDKMGIEKERFTEEHLEKESEDIDEVAITLEQDNLKENAVQEGIASDIFSFIVETEQEAAPVMEGDVAANTGLIDLFQDDLGQPKDGCEVNIVPLSEETGIQFVEEIVNASISGETWSLQTEQAIDNIYVEEDSAKIDIQEEINADFYIDEAFKLKECGDFEGAILHYMYALDKNPEKDVVFWIVLDTCVLYKELGQTELAREILKSYVEGFGDIMNPSVRMEIERNLSDNNV